MFSATIIVAHAPHSRAPPEDRERWWNALAQDIAIHGGDFILIDANARLGSVHTTSVGGQGYAQTEDASGALLHEVLLQGNLAA
eukprot:8631624-Heterocapsa_arctica.AAC.1